MSAQPSGTALVVKAISNQEFQTQIAKALPHGVSVDRFTRAAITALQKNPDVCEKGERNSLYGAILESAQSGLLCDGKQAALVIYNTNVGTRQQPRWIAKVQFMPMVGGITLNLARVGASVDTQVVHEHDVFEVELGDNPTIKHIPPKLGKDRGEMIGAYAIITKDGVKFREIMDRAQIEAVRQQSRAPDSLMWSKFASEGWRKTVLRRCAKRVPITDEVVQRMIEADDKSFQFDDPPDIQQTPTPAPETVVSSQEPPAKAPAQAQAEQPATKARRRPQALQRVMDEDQPPPMDLPPVEAYEEHAEPVQRQAPQPEQRMARPQEEDFF